MGDMKTLQQQFRKWKYDNIVTVYHLDKFYIDGRQKIDRYEIFPTGEVFKNNDEMILYWLIIKTFV